LTLADPDILRKSLSQFNNQAEREELLSAYYATPYQVIHDSPTIKTYTEWSTYERLNIRNVNVPKVVEGSEIIIDDEKIIRPSHVQVSDLMKGTLFRKDDGKLVSLAMATAKVMKIEKSGNYVIRHKASSGLSPIHLIIKSSPRDLLNVTYLLEVNGEPVLPLSLISIEAEKDSSVSFSGVILGGRNPNFISVKANVRGSLNTTLFSTESSMSHVSLKTNVDSNAKSTFSALALGTERDRIDMVTDVSHVGAKSVSDGKLKGITADEAEISVRGIAEIKEEATDSSTSITGRAMILSPFSHASVVPMLEVKTGRVVMAKHSAAVSKINEDMIFYLKSRGLTQKEAEGMIIRGFIEDEVTDLIRDKIEQILYHLGY
jgi:hypothetical protein